MDIYEKYFFDVNGYLVAEDILSPDQVAALNDIRYLRRPRARGRCRGGGVEWRGPSA